MKRFDGFLVTILLLVFSLSLVYYYSNKFLNYFDQNPTLARHVERQKNLISLKKKLVSIRKISQSRNLASVNRSELSTQLSPESDSDFKNLAERYFHQAERSCHDPGDSHNCVQNIEIVVSQFPETRWAGESLLLLTEFYYRTKRVNQAKEVVKIVKEEFHHFPLLQDKLGALEKAVF